MERVVAGPDLDQVTRAEAPGLVVAHRADNPVGIAGAADDDHRLSGAVAARRMLAVAVSGSVPSTSSHLKNVITLSPTCTQHSLRDSCAGQLVREDRKAE